MLSRIPALTLADSYAQGEAYEYLAAFRRACLQVLGPELADSVERTLLLLDDTGLDRLGEERHGNLRKRFGAFDHPAAREIMAWLDGAWRIGTEEIETQ